MERYPKKPERDSAIQMTIGTTNCLGSLATGGGFTRRELIAGKLARSVPGGVRRRKVLRLLDKRPKKQD